MSSSLNLNLNKMDSTVVLVQLSAVSLALVPVVLGLTSLVKNFLDSKWSPIVSLVLGVGAAFIVPEVSIQLTVLQGILVGLTASGLYSGIKAVVTQ